MEEAAPRAVTDDRTGSAIGLDCSMARTTGFCSVLPRAACEGFAQAGMGSGERVRRRHGLSGATDCRRDSQVAPTDRVSCSCAVAAAEEFREPGTAPCRIACQRCTSGCGDLAWGLAVGRAFGKPPSGTGRRLAT
jgi:hypothetical protein